MNLEERRSVALEQYRRRVDTYDAELSIFEPVRRLAVDRLGLWPGQTVLDVGCGTGLSFPLLLAAIGEAGRIVGIEQSPEMLDRARERVRSNGWLNVTLIEAPIEDARIDLRADAALLHFTHDILRDRAAIANVLRHLKVGARICAAGLKLPAPENDQLTRIVLRSAGHSMTTTEGLEHPWNLLQALTERHALEVMLGGSVYVFDADMRNPHADR